MQHKSICFIGGGNMTQAIVFGLLKQGYPAAHITVCDHNETKLALFAERGVQISTNNEQSVKQAEVVVLAVKPQAAEAACAALSAVDFSDKLLISIMAAISSQRLTALLPSAHNIVRVMPNTPALVSEGMAGLFAPTNVVAEFKQFAQELLSAVGKTCWVEQESDMHVVTAASGSSPAYFFLFMEAMQQALSNMGLTEQQAREFIQQSALGAAKMVVEKPQFSFTTLRENVTSKGGTTAAALAIFEQHQLASTVEQAMQACVARSQEMEKLF
ncbi:pyrroline-5-carboxylate reductase [Pasteurella langaaensis DSM 22999]|uniref:Pyrroline-5-carboxylate reductase n=1 Tax=Alitibacter langaaensis DSM 22999 TaxID=1122935 RepID=A0A2U0SL82_9PAST|nr:pyrroline-5-carboxylate reductase [Pasteurella langaaensis]PVX32082.1 pyrroline-5-carboxylate reductase [Pasteurella langaaensis DSM 22999]